MADTNVEKQWDDGLDLKMDEFIRTLLQQMFECDNGTSYVEAELGSGDKATAVVLRVDIVSINGIEANPVEETA